MTTEDRELRDVLSDANIYMKYIPFNEKEGGYFIGNCNIKLSLKDTVLRFVSPPQSEVEATQDDEHNKAVGRLVVLNGTYNNEEFEEFMSETDELDDAPSYFFGLCNMDIHAQNTVLKFFPERFGKQNVLVIQQTQKRDGQRINNPVEVNVFMRCKNLK